MSVRKTLVKFLLLSAVAKAVGTAVKSKRSRTVTITSESWPDVPPNPAS